MLPDAICHFTSVGLRESSKMQNQDRVDLGWALVVDMCCFVATGIQNLYGGNPSLAIGTVLSP